MTTINNSVEVYVQDAVGGVYCHSCGDIATKERAVAHARWYVRQRKHIGFDGKPVPICRPLKVVAIDYFDPSAVR